MRPLVRQPKVFVHISKRNTHKPCSLWLLYVSVYLSLANQLFFNEENKMNSQKELQKVHWSWKELSESRSIWSKNIILLLPFHAFHHASSRFIVFFTFGSSLHVRFFVCCVVWALIMFFAKKCSHNQWWVFIISKKAIQKSFLNIYLFINEIFVAQILYGEWTAEDQLIINMSSAANLCCFSHFAFSITTLSTLRENI